MNRGEGLEPVNSCEGLADPPHFYLAAVWLSAGLTTATLFLLAALLAGGSLTGGLLAVACFFYNHGEATRVMWTPPLRESFAFPLCLLQVPGIQYTYESTKKFVDETFYLLASFEIKKKLFKGLHFFFPLIIR